MKLFSLNQRLALLTVCFLIFTIAQSNKSFAAYLNLDLLKPAPPAEAIKQQLMAWNTETLVQAYERAGHTNLVWDKAAKIALVEFARGRSKLVDTNEPLAKIITTNTANAIKSGCDDPLIKYLNLRYDSAHTNSPEILASEFGDIALGMERSSYPSIRKFYAINRVLIYTRLIKKDKQLTLQLRQKFIPLFIKEIETTLHDKSVPEREAFDVANDTLAIMDGDKANYKFACDWIHSLFENWPEAYTTWLLKGRANIRLAWDARGEGYADTVTDEGWKIMGEKLAIARKALERAWLLNPRDSAIAYEMMTVALGEGGKQKSMELWFDRAMELNPNDYGACRQKLYYLEPKWYGSDADQLAFGHRCVLSKKWGGSVPLILIDAHLSINERNEKSQQAAYWKQPSVWTDVQASIEDYIKLNPDAKNRYQLYAFYAYKAEQWGKLNELIPKLEQGDYGYFGGKAEFDKMIQMAKSHVK